MAAKRFNWEAALMPLWGWRREVPFAVALSVLFPFLVIAVLISKHVISWLDLALGYALVGLGYGLLYGWTADWMLARAGPRDSARSPGLLRKLIRSLGGVIAALLLLAANFVLVVSVVASHPMQRAYVAQMKADLRNLVEAQDVHFEKSGRFATALDSLEYGTSQDVTVSFVHADDQSWAARALHREIDMECTIFVGNWPGAPAESLQREPTCERPRR